MADTKLQSAPTVPTIDDLNDFLGSLNFGMREIVVWSEEEAIRVQQEQEAEGYRCACMSNAGLPQGACRLTYLPSDRFAPEPEGVEHDTRDGLPETGETFVDGPPVSKKPTRNIQDWLDDEDALAQVPYVHAGTTELPPMVRIELEQLTTLARAGGEVVYYDIGVAEHWAVGNNEQGRVRRRIQTRQRIHDGDIPAARAEAIRRSIDFAAGGLVGYHDWDSGNGDPVQEEAEV